MMITAGGHQPLEIELNGGQRRNLLEDVLSRLIYIIIIQVSSCRNIIIITTSPHFHFQRPSFRPVQRHMDTDRGIGYLSADMTPWPLRRVRHICS